VVDTELEEGLLLVVVGQAAVGQESKGLAVPRRTALRRHQYAQNMATASAVLIRLAVLLVVQGWELVEEDVDPMTRAPVAAQQTALMMRRCAVSMDIANALLTRLEALRVDLGLVAVNSIRQGHRLREEQVDTVKEGHKLGSPVVKIRPGANLGVLDSTRVLGLTKDQTRVLDSTKDQTKDLGSTKDQAMDLGLTKDLGSTKDQAQDSAVEVQTPASARVPVQATTNKAQVGPTMATLLLPHPVLMLC